MRDGTDPTWDVNDYLVAFEDIVWPGGELVDLPLELKIQKVGQHVATVLREGTSCLAVGGELGAAMLGLAAVDYMAGFHHGRESTRGDFIAFLHEWFPQPYADHSEWIYANLRCGLMHNLTAANPWRGQHRRFSITGEGDVHLSESDGVLTFQVHVFLIDVYRAWVMFSHHLVMKAGRDGNEVQQFLRRFDRLGGIAAFMAKE